MWLLLVQMMPLNTLITYLLQYICTIGSAHIKLMYQEKSILGAFNTIAALRGCLVVIILD